MVVHEGEIDVDQSPLTGESMLIPKSDAEGHNEVLYRYISH